MIPRLINFTLLLVAVVGMIFTFQAPSELRSVRAEHDSLAARFGTLDVCDHAAGAQQRYPVVG